MRYRSAESLEADGALRLRGVAVRYGEVAGPPQLPFRERIEAGAFAPLGDVHLDVQHRRDRLLARTGGGGLMLIDSPEALRFEAELPDTSEARDAVTLVRRGILRGASIEFASLQERVVNGVVSVSRARLGGLGVVDAPAYLGSVIEARAEVRQSGQGLEGTFFYNEGTVVSDRQASVRKSRVSPGAFSMALQDPGREVSVLLGRDYGQPLASKLAGSVVFDDGPDALRFTIEQLPATSYVSDLRAQLAANSGTFGVAPLYRIPPPEVVPDAVEEIAEVGNPDTLIQVVREAVLTGLAVVVRGPRGNPGNIQLRGVKLWL